MTGDLVRGHGAATLFEAAQLDCACDPAIRSAWPGARLAGAAFTVQGMGGDNLGGIRDIDEIRQLGFAVFSRNNSIRGTSKDHPGRFGEPVRVGGLVVAAGDLIVGDTDGVVALPAARADQILERADERAAAERRAMAALRAGETTMAYYQLDAAGAGAGRGAA